MVALSAAISYRDEQRRASLRLVSAALLAEALLAAGWIVLATVA